MKPTTTAVTPPPLILHVYVLCGQERHHWVCPELSRCLVAWAMHSAFAAPGEYRLDFARGFPTSQQARNWATDRFLATPSNQGGIPEYMLMVDNDTDPSGCEDGLPLDVAGLALTGKPIIACPILTMDGDRYFYNAYIEDLEPETGKSTIRNLSHQELTGKSDSIPVDQSGVLEVPMMGSGLILIRRDVIEAMKRYPYTYDPDLNHKVKISRDLTSFPAWLRTRSLDGSTKVGEDLLFCRRAADLGYKTHCAPLSMRGGHFHTINYEQIPAFAYAADNHESARADFVNEGLIEDNSKFQFTPYCIDCETATKLRLMAISKRRTMALELGMGASTEVLLKAFKNRPVPIGSTHVLVSIEESEEHITNYPRSPFYAHYPMKVGLGKNGFYKSNTLRKALQAVVAAERDKFNLVLIDGPSVANGGKRSPAIDLLIDWDVLQPGCFIIVDDANREHEKAMISKAFSSHFPDLTAVGDVGRTAVLRYK